MGLWQSRSAASYILPFSEGKAWLGCGALLGRRDGEVRKENTIKFTKPEFYHS